MSLRPIKKSDASKPWAARKDRKSARRDERQYILVASEDGKSSVYYFDAFNTRLRSHAATTVVFPKGCGRNTQSLVNYVKKHKGDWLEEIRKDFLIDDFNEIWIVFDLDGFPLHKFDNAIVSAQKHGFQVAWSNECFELWYLLHLKDMSTPIGRNAIYKGLTEFLQLEQGYTKLKGAAGKDVHEAMASHPDVGKAIKRARKLYANYNDSGLPPHKGNPCTLVFKLVEKLLKQMAV